MQEVEYLTVDVDKVLQDHTMIKEWAYIIHDKDPGVKPHYHIYMNFGSGGAETEKVAKWFGLAPQYVSKIKGKKHSALLYLIHANASCREKYQYQPSEVTANFDYEKEIRGSQMIGDFGKYSYAEQLVYVKSLSPDEQGKAFDKLEKLWKIECQTAGLNPNRNLEVMFICGATGTGKTHYAKKFLKTLGYDFCISSSSNDPFQDYLGQRAIILDDLRDKAFEMEDLLKILDNNTASSVRSRFSNKVFTGKMIVITSSVPLSQWYWQYKANSFDTLEQLYRRITWYVDVTHDLISIYRGLGKDGHPHGCPTRYRNTLRWQAFEEKETSDVLGSFDSFLTREPIPYSPYMVEQLRQQEGDLDDDDRLPF